MTNYQKYAFEATKDIVIAKLSNANPSAANESAGKAIGEMFEAIYDKIYEICTKEETN